MAVREGTVNSDQLWGLNSKAGAAVCLGVDMCGAGRCMLDWRMQLHYIWCVVVTVEAMADNLAASNYPVHDACRTMHATCHITTGSLPYHIGASCEVEQHKATQRGPGTPSGQGKYNHHPLLLGRGILSIVPQWQRCVCCFKRSRTKPTFENARSWNGDGKETRSVPLDTLADSHPALH
jgi:hypothetical protein